MILILRPSMVINRSVANCDNVRMESAYLQAGHLYDRYLEYLNTSKK